jgi:hypothetical protein
MAKSSLPTIFVLAGIVLLGISWILPTLVGGRHAWTDEDAKLYEQANTERHRARTEYGVALERLPPAAAKAAEAESTGGNAGSALNSPAGAKLRATSDRVVEADERYRTLEAKLQRAQAGGLTAADVLKWVGIAVITIGAIGYYTTRPSANDEPISRRR